MEIQPGAYLNSKPLFLNCVEWSNDGQVLVCFEDAVHILTPALTGLSSEGEGFTHEGISTKELTTRELDEQQLFDRSIQTSYVVAECFRSAIWSPTGLSKEYGCFLTAVTTKHRVTFYAKPEEGQSSWKRAWNVSRRIYNHVKGYSDESSLEIEVTDNDPWAYAVGDEFEEEEAEFGDEDDEEEGGEDKDDDDNDNNFKEDDPKEDEDSEMQDEDDNGASKRPNKDKDVMLFASHDEVKRFQTLFCAWSPTIITSPLAEKPAILALSHKSGDVTLWSFSRHKGLKFLTEYKTTSTYVNLLKWSNWRVQGNKYTAYLMSSSTNGSVYLTSITIDVMMGQYLHVDITSSTVNMLYSWFEGDFSIPTLLTSWDNLSNHGDQVKFGVSKGISTAFIFLIIKGDTVHVEQDWVSYIPENSSMGPANITWIEDGDYLRLYTHEGQGIVLCMKNNTVEFDLERSQALTDSLMLKYKFQFMEIESKAADDDTVGEGSNIDVIPLLWGSALSFNQLFTALAFTIKPLNDVYNRSDGPFGTFLGFIIHSQREDFNTLDVLCKNTEKYIQDPDFLFTYPVKIFLHEALEYVVNDEDNDGIYVWLATISNLLNSPRTIDTSKDALTRNIYSNTANVAAMVINCIRLQLKFLELPPPVNDELNRLHEKASKMVQHFHIMSVLSFILDCSDEEFKKFDDDDVMVIQLLCDSALSESSIESLLLDTVLKTHTALERCLPELGPFTVLLEEIERAAANVADRKEKKSVGYEKCPICTALVIPSKGTFATCLSGHTWEQCCMTMRVILTPNARKCINCNAKSLQPGSIRALRPSNDDPDRLSLTDTILTKCFKCFKCGYGLTTTDVL
ncbi:transcription factor IIIC subunit delta N-term-domain-containing protein [Spinellus fusiger]|nr:transcription factor IIIC subunit delta N-term-domain-containing protein [Spinellus fusiger]